MKKNTKKIIKKTKPKTPAKKVKLSDEQLNIIIDKFYESTQAKVLDLIFESSQTMIDEMLGFVIQQAFNDGLKVPVDNKNLSSIISKVMESNSKEMAQDLIFNQVSVLMNNEVLPEIIQESDDFDAKRGL